MPGSKGPFAVREGGAGGSRGLVQRIVHQHSVAQRHSWFAGQTRGVTLARIFHRPFFARGIVKLEDLEPGMQMSGTVLNVVDFGAFVDIGLPDSGLVHISRLADRFVRDPHEVVGVGDVIAVWVVEVDKPRRRVSLTAIKPGTETPPSRPPGSRPAA